MTALPRGLAVAVGLLLAACGGHEEPAFVPIPGGLVALGSRDPSARNPPHTVRIAPFSIAARETTVAGFTAFLNDTGASPGLSPHPDMAHRGRRWVPAAGRARMPVTHVTRHEAEAYCGWLSRRLGRRIRLPTEDEWEAAARGGIRGAPWPWGWGSAEGRAILNRPGPSAAGDLPANGYGLHDAAGNVFEWCAGEAAGGIPARGGAWAEQDPDMGTVARRFAFRTDYRGADTGFRVAAD